MTSLLKYLPVLCFACVLTVPYGLASTTNIGKKRAYSLRHSSVLLEKCLGTEPCMDSSGEENLNAVCQYGCFKNQSLRCIKMGGKFMRFCYDNQICQAGTWDIADHVDGLDDKIILIQEECPDRYFQPHPTPCDKACRSYRHVPVPSYMVQLLAGNASASAVAYCDSQSGWVSFNGRTFFEVSLEQGSRMCEKSRDQCQNETDLLPNGTCAVTCRPGQHRVPEDHFNCRVSDTNRYVSTSPVPEPEDDAKDSGKGPSYTTNVDQKTTVIAIVCTVLACAFIVIGAVFAIRRRQKRPEERQTPAEERTQMLEQVVSGGSTDTTPDQNNEQGHPGHSSDISQNKNSEQVLPSCSADTSPDQNSDHVTITKKEVHNIQYGNIIHITGDNTTINVSKNNDDTP